MLSIPQWLKLPRICLVCQMPFTRHTPMCDLCEKKLNILNHLCLFCTEPILENDKEFCLTCQYQVSDIRKIYVFFEYVKPLKNLITDFKFKHGYDLLPYLGDLLLEQLPPDALETECLIPVPLHRKKQNSRGYHQTYLLTGYLSKKLNVPMSMQFCQKIKNTAAQSKLNAAERQNNLNDAFIFKKPPYQKITLIDDIITTGSTLKTLAKGFQNLGIEHIDAWCLAKSLKNSS